MKVLSLLPLLAVASCLPIYANIRVVKINGEGVTSVKDYKHVNLDGIESLEQLAVSPDDVKTLESAEPVEDVKPKHHPKFRPHAMKPCHGKKKHQQGNEKHGFRKAEKGSFVAGPFKTYEEVKEFTEHLVHDGGIKDENVESNFYDSAKIWADGMVQDFKDTDFKESMNNFISENDDLLSLCAGALSGSVLFCGVLYFVMYLVNLRKAATSEFKDYEAPESNTQAKQQDPEAQLPEYDDEKLPLYEEYSDNE